MLIMPKNSQRKKPLVSNEPNPSALYIYIRQAKVEQALYHVDSC